MTLVIGSLTSCGKKDCTDPTASNYDIDATKDDGSCEFTTMTFIHYLEIFTKIKP